MIEMRSRDEIKARQTVLTSAILREELGDWVFGEDFGALGQVSAMASALDWVLGRDNVNFLGIFAKAERGLKELGINLPEIEGGELK